MTSTTTTPLPFSADMLLTAFDGEQGVTVRAPEKDGPHYWAGCPGAYHDERTGHFYLTYRRRNPRGVEPERGYVNTLARSEDGVHFEDIWSVTKQELDSSSMERSCLFRNGDGWTLLFSYVDPVDNRWRIDKVTADEPDRFDVSDRTAVLTAESTGTEGVKDPFVVRTGPVWTLFASFASARPMTAEERERAHGTADIYTTGLTTHPTGWATSLDGADFAWQGQALGVGSGWDCYQARLSSVIKVDGGFLGFYDGSASEKENYEERCGLAHSVDLRTWTRLTPAQPWFTSRHATGSLRYVAAVTVGDSAHLYYEYARPDGSHELRVKVLGRDAR